MIPSLLDVRGLLLDFVGKEACLAARKAWGTQVTRRPPAPQPSLPLTSLLASRARLRLGAAGVPGEGRRPRGRL